MSPSTSIPALLGAGFFASCAIGSLVDLAAAGGRAWDVQDLAIAGTPGTTVTRLSTDDRFDHWRGDDGLAVELPPGGAIAIPFESGPDRPVTVELGYSSGPGLGPATVLVNGQVTGRLTSGSGAPRLERRTLRWRDTGGGRRTVTVVASGKTRLELDDVVVRKAGGSRPLQAGVLLGLSLVALAAGPARRLVKPALFVCSGASILAYLAPHRFYGAPSNVDFPASGAAVAFRLPWDPGFLVMGAGATRAALLAAGLLAGAAIPFVRKAFETSAGSRRFWLLVPLLPLLLPIGLATPYAVEVLVANLGSALLLAGLARLPVVVGFLSRLAGPLLRGASAVSSRAYGSILFGAAVLLSGGASGLLFHHVPHIMDSAAQLFQARVFSSGHLTATTPTIPGFFSWMFMAESSGRWFSIYPPGQSLLLTPGVLLGVPWLVNPILGGATAWLLYRFAAETHGEATGRLTGALVVSSPFVIFMSSEYMNHAGALAAFSSGLLFFGRAVRAGRVRDGIAAGVAFGVLALIRPLTAVALVAPLFSFWVYRIVASRTGRLAPFAAAVGSGALVASMLLPYNAATTGDPWRLGYQVVFGSGVGPGFGRVGRGSAHTVATGLVHTGVNLVAAEKAVFEWPLPSVIFVGALLASGRVVAWDAALGASAIGLALAYLTYFYQDLCFGPRFLYEATAVVCVLTARGLVEGVRRFRGTEPEAARRAVALLAALVVWALAVPVPNLVRLYSADYMGGTSRAVDAVRAAGVGNALVFVRSFYPSAFSQNAPTLDGDVVYAQDLPDRERLMRAYPGRTAFLEDGGRLQPLSPLRGTGLAR